MDVNLSTRNNELKNTTVYPNPFKDILYLKSDSKITNVKIYSASGNLVLNKNYDAKEISINTQLLLIGVYTVKITSDNKEVVKQVIKN